MAKTKTKALVARRNDVRAFREKPWHKNALQVESFLNRIDATFAEIMKAAHAIELMSKGEQMPDSPASFGWVAWRIWAQAHDMQTLVQRRLQEAKDAKAGAA